MSFGTPAAVLLAILFLIPGFIWRKAAQWFSPYVPRKKAEILEYLALSCLNYLLGVVLLFLLLICCPENLHLTEPWTLLDHPAYVAGWLALVFILPVLLGAFSVFLSRHPRVSTAMARIGISVLHPAPTAWDYAFARRERYWARIELTDGQIIEGMFDSSSLASGEPDERDIFLEQVFEWDDERKQYNAVERCAGVWVSAGQIRAIRLFAVDPPSSSEARSGTNTPTPEATEQARLEKET